MNHDHYSSAYICNILGSVHTIAVVGASPNDSVIPVNPGHAGKTILGQTVFARLADIPEPVDMVDVFRAASHFGDVVDEVLRLKPLPAVIWGQFSVRDDDAARRAEAAGLQVVMDRCPVTEFPHLMRRAS